MKPMPPSKANKVAMAEMPGTLPSIDSSWLLFVCVAALDARGA